MSGVIRVRFPSPRVAGQAYEQQRIHHNTRDTQSARLIGHAGQVCPTIIPTRHNGETSQDDSLHKVYISCSAFRGKDNNGINQLFRDNLREIYDAIFDIDAELVEVPEDYYTIISNATEAAGEGHIALMAIYDLLYLFEYYKIAKIGGANSPYACAEWPGIQIPQTILSLLNNKGLQFTFYNDKREASVHALLLYERNTTGRGLDFDDFPEDKPEFIRYASEFRCLNPVVDTKKTPVPPLEDLAEAVTILPKAGHQHNKDPRKELEKILLTEGASKEWFLEPYGPCTRDLRINSHLGAGEVMTTGRIQDPEGAKIVIISFKAATRVVATIHRQTFRIVCFKDTTRGRLRVDAKATTGGKHDPSKQGLRSILIYLSHMYTEASLDPKRCSLKVDQKVRNQWVDN